MKARKKEKKKNGGKKEGRRCLAPQKRGPASIGEEKKRRRKERGHRKTKEKITSNEAHQKIEHDAHMGGKAKPHCRRGGKKKKGGKGK